MRVIRSPHLSCLVGAGLVSACLAGVALGQSARDPAPTRPRAVDPDDIGIPIVPTRRAPDEPPPPPPELPPGAERVVPLTLEVRLDQHTPAGRPKTVRQTITRTADRIHLVVSDGPEWLFERNPVDPRRVSGSLIEHAARAIVFYSDSDLRNMLGLAGWAPVLTLGFDHRLLSNLEPSEDVRTIGGFRFVRFTNRSRANGALEVWWNDQAIVPGTITTSSGKTSTRFSIERISRTVDRDLLGPPSSRFPNYDPVDLADWLEHR